MLNSLIFKKKKLVFSLFPKSFTFLTLFKPFGKPFHKLGPSTSNLRFPILDILDLGTSKLVESKDLSFCLSGISEIGMSLSDMYFGPYPSLHLNISNNIL